MHRSGATIDGVSLVQGRASGRALVLEEPLSFWGGVDANTGTRQLVVPSTRSHLAKYITSRRDEKLDSVRYAPPIQQRDQLFEFLEREVRRPYAYRGE